ncbi:DoxX family protein [Streptomyces sp. Edi4]|uniref:DoxX family protein n=1 Tax=Streptomyces sp. Edi4 TaxID=3162527 RepID=UPI003305B7CE
MSVAYWIVAGLFALFFLYSGGIKIVRSREGLRPVMAWVDTLAMPTVRLIGLAEVLGAAGLILPPLTGIAPWLALLAAIGFEVLQMGATVLHLRRHERDVALNLTLLATGAVTLWLASTW